MLSTMLNTLLVAALYTTTCVGVTIPSRGLSHAATPGALELALPAAPGLTFSRAVPSPASDPLKRSKNRFKPAKHWTTIHAHHGGSVARTRGGSSLAFVRGKHAGKGYTNITSAGAHSTAYGVDVSFGRQALRLILDTGSSDTWAVSSRSNCTAWSGACLFGSRYAGGFTGGAIAGEHLYVEYGGGEVVRGAVGYMDVSVAGVAVRDQVVGIANSTLWAGDNATSGILGLAYPAITNAYDGGAAEHDSYYRMEYAPVFSNMVGQGLTDNYFSIALGRGASDGVLAFGGVPEPLAGVDYSVTAVTDIIIANLLDDGPTASDYSFYTIIPDGWLFGTSTDDRKMPYVVDSGTTLNYLPIELADAVNAAYEPAAEYDFMYGAYLTSCDATPPRLAVVIGDTPFWLSAEDLILRDSRDPLSGLCMTTITASEEGPFILGDVFLKNVLAVFDVEDAVMQFASRSSH